MRLLRPILAVVVLVVAALVLVGVGQGHPGPQIPVSAKQVAAGRRRVARLGREGRIGQAQFSSQGCSACHTIAASGFDGRLGPNLDGYLHGVPKSAIKSFILDPLTVMIPGFTHDLMPNNFGKRLTRGQLRALVDYLHAVSG